MIPVIQREMNRHGWISPDEFPDIVALSQSAPGVMAVNIAVFTGYRLRGVRGSIVAALGCVLPSFLIILAIATGLSGLQDNPLVVKAFKGIRPAVIALIAVPMLEMAKKNKRNRWSWAISVATLLLVAFLKVSPIYILLVLTVISVSIRLYREKKEGGR